MGALLDFDGVSAGYGAQPVLRGLSFSVAAGEAWAVLGPNGAGKSTLVRAVMGLLAPSAGVVRLAGRPVSSPPSGSVTGCQASVPSNAG